MDFFYLLERIINWGHLRKDIEFIIYYYTNQTPQYGWPGRFLLPTLTQKREMCFPNQS